MKIVFRQDGGLAANRDKVDGCEVDSDTLVAKEAARLLKLVAQCGFTQSFAKKSPQLRDAFVYTIELHDKKKHVRIQFDDGTVPPQCTPLLEYLQSRSSPRDRT